MNDCEVCKNAGGCCVPATKGEFSSCRSTLWFFLWSWKARLFSMTFLQRRTLVSCMISRRFYWALAGVAFPPVHRTYFGQNNHLAKMDGNSSIPWWRGITCRAKNKLLWIGDDRSYPSPEFRELHAISIKTFCVSNHHGRAFYTFLDIRLHLKRAHTERDLQHLCSIFCLLPVEC